MKYFLIGAVWVVLFAGAFLAGYIIRLVITRLKRP